MTWKPGVQRGRRGPGAHLPQTSWVILANDSNRTEGGQCAGSAHVDERTAVLGRCANLVVMDRPGVSAQLLQKPLPHLTNGAPLHRQMEGNTCVRAWETVRRAPQNTPAG